jgi:hypothetical protein
MSRLGPSPDVAAAGAAAGFRRRESGIDGLHLCGQPTTRQHVDCDVYRIEAADPYPDGYDGTVARNVTEQDADARPEITDPVTSIDGYEHVLLGSPIWNVRPLMIMSRSPTAFDFTGRTVHPFVIYTVGGLGRTERDYAASCAGARISPGAAVHDQEVTEHRDEATTWAARTD